MIFIKRKLAAYARCAGLFFLCESWIKQNCKFYIVFQRNMNLHSVCHSVFLKIIRTPLRFLIMRWTKVKILRSIVKYIFQKLLKYVLKILLKKSNLNKKILNTDIFRLIHWIIYKTHKKHKYSVHKVVDKEISLYYKVKLQCPLYFQHSSLLHL